MGALVKHLFVTQDFGPDLGGMARRHVELCRRFAPDDVVVSTVATSVAGAFDVNERYAIRRQPFPFGHANRFVNQMRWARALVKESSRGVHIVHCGNIRPCGYAVSMARLACSRPYILYVYGGDLLRERDVKARSPVKRRAARRILGDANGIVAISEWSATLARDLMTLVGVAHPPPVRAIPLGTDPVQFSPSRDRGWLRRRFALAECPVVLTVARLVPHKGQDVGLHAIARLMRELPLVRYVLVGEGPDRPRLERLAQTLGIAERVVFAGAVSDDDLADAYASASVYLGLSRVDDGVNVEGFGISFVEAAASGVPCVAGDSGGVRSAVRDGETGLVVSPTDTDAVVHALRAMLSDDALRRKLGDQARRAVETYYNWDRVARETLAFAREMAGLGLAVAADAAA
jgi:phosphatidyl-myo-inositol dimannoside synthase